MHISIDWSPGPRSGQVARPAKPQTAAFFKRIGHRDGQTTGFAAAHQRSDPVGDNDEAAAGVWHATQILLA
jgi:hypothetical protein